MSCRPYTAAPPLLHIIVLMHFHVHTHTPLLHTHTPTDSELECKKAQWRSNEAKVESVEVVRRLHTTQPCCSKSEQTLRYRCLTGRYLSSSHCRVPTSPSVPPSLSLSSSFSSSRLKIFTAALITGMIKYGSPGNASLRM